MRDFTLVDINAENRFEPPDGPAVVFHVTKDFVNTLSKRKVQIYSQIRQMAQRLAIPLYVLSSKGESLDGIIDHPQHFHLARQDRPYKASNLFYAMPGYLRGFWYFDPDGVRNHSSIRHKVFDPSTIDEKSAAAFFENLRAQFVDRNFSKWPQAKRGSEKLKPHSVFLCLQAEKPFPYDKRYFSTQALIKAAIDARGARTLYIKPHPKAPLREQEALLAYHNPDEGIEITVASIHDLIAHADFMITQSSAVALEAQLQKTPAILSGQTDFAHNSITIESPLAMPSAIEQALEREFHYEKFLYWFLHENLIETEHLQPRVLWQKLAESGIEFGEQALRLSH